MSTKPQNTFDDQKEYEEKTRRKHFAQKREKMLHQRLGLTRKNRQVRINGLDMALIGSPQIVQERWCHVKRRTFERGGKKGRTFYFAVLRYSLQSADGRQWTALQAQAHDGNRGYVLNVTGFWNLQSA